MDNRTHQLTVNNCIENDPLMLHIRSGLPYTHPRCFNCEVGSTVPRS